MRPVLWLLQRLTGIVLLAGLLVHFYVMHYTGQDTLTHEAILARLRNPFWKIFDLVFLVSVTLHGFNGLSGIVVEYIKNEPLTKTLKYIILLLALVVTITGIKIIMA